MNMEMHAMVSRLFSTTGLTAEKFHPAPPNRRQAGRQAAFLETLESRLLLSSSMAVTASAPLAAPEVVGSALGPTAINLATAGHFAILAKTGISTTGTTAIVGDIGVSPAGATYITGFGLTLPAGSAFATSPIVVGKVYAPDYASPTPDNMTTSIGDMQTAYADGAGRTNPTATELGAGNIGGLTIAPGFYKWSSGVIIPTDVTLSGQANSVWIFQIAQTLTVSAGAHINLSGGAQASNIFWVVAGQTSIGTTAVFQGNILDQTAIVLNTGAQLNGRALAQTAVTLDANAVNRPNLPASGHLIATGPQAGSSSVPTVKVFDAANGTEKFEFLAYDAAYRGDVRLALGDVTGDGVPDIVTATGQGGVPLVNIYDGTDGHLLGNFWAYIQDYQGGVQVAVADVTGDGVLEIVTSTDSGGLPLVNVYNGSGTMLMNFWAYDQNYWGGVRIGAGDFNNDGKAEIITSTASGGLPLINVFNSAGALVGNFWAESQHGDGSWYTGGWRCAAGDVNNDGTAEAVLVKDAGAVPTVKVFNVGSQSLLSQFQPFDASVTSGLRVGLTDANSDGYYDIVVAAGAGTEPLVKIFDGQTNALIRSFLAYDSSMQMGLFVSAG